MAADRPGAPMEEPEGSVVVSVCPGSLPAAIWKSSIKSARVGISPPMKRSVRDATFFSHMLNAVQHAPNAMHACSSLDTWSKGRMGELAQRVLTNPTYKPSWNPSCVQHAFVVHHTKGRMVTVHVHVPVPVGSYPGILIVRYLIHVATSS